MTEQTQGATGPVEVVTSGQSDTVPDIYTNSVQITVSTYDVLLHLFHQDAVLGDDTPTRQLVGKLWMSHAQAWTVVRLLDRLLDRYVETVGAVHLPEATIDAQGLREEYEAMLEKAKK